MSLIVPKIIRINLATFIFVVFLYDFPASAATFEAVEESEEVEMEHSRIYRNPAERREAGLSTEIMDGLTFSGLLELEKIKTRQHFKTNVTEQEDEPTTTTLQLAFKSEYEDWFEAEVVFETEYSRHLHEKTNSYHYGTHSIVDEATITIDIDDFGLQIGRINIPFGEYNSYFVIGPLLEFGETRRDTVLIDYSVNDNFEVSVFCFESKIDKLGQDNSYDCGSSLEYKSDYESVILGASYTSDLSESDEEFLSEYSTSYQNQVSAWSAYLLFGFEDFEISLETVQARDNFTELDPTFNKPSATNLEVAYFISDELIVAARLAQSKELEDAPELQYGLSTTLLTRSRFVFSFDYLYGQFKKNFVLNDDDIALSHQHQVGLRVSMEL